MGIGGISVDQLLFLAVILLALILAPVFLVIASKRIQGPAKSRVEIIFATLAV